MVKNFHDPAAEQAERERRETLANNSELQRGIAAAKLNQNNNLERALFEAIASVNLCAVTESTSYNQRLRYERAYENMRKAARQVIFATGKGVQVPKYIHPPEPTASNTETLTADDFRSSDMYRETGGLGPSGKGGPVPDFSGDNTAWLDVQGVTNKGSK